jgi:hypothetical protein
MKCPSLRQIAKALSFSSIKIRLNGQEKPIWPMEVTRRRKDYIQISDDVLADTAQKHNKERQNTETLRNF